MTNPPELRTRIRLVGGPHLADLAPMPDGSLGVDLAKVTAVPRVAEPTPFGLGDLVAKVAQPIAGVIDRVTGTRLKGCGGCAARQAALNRLVPDLRHPAGPKPG
jgi:hypothetical protein